MFDESKANQLSQPILRRPSSGAVYVDHVGSLNDNPESKSGDCLIRGLGSHVERVGPVGSLNANALPPVPEEFSNRASKGSVSFCLLFIILSEALVILAGAGLVIYHQAKLNEIDNLEETQANKEEMEHDISLFYTAGIGTIVSGVIVMFITIFVYFAFQSCCTRVVTANGTCRSPDRFFEKCCKCTTRSSQEDRQLPQVAAI